MADDHEAAVDAFAEGRGDGPERLWLAAAGDRVGRCGQCSGPAATRSEATRQRTRYRGHWSCGACNRSRSSPIEACCWTTRSTSTLAAETDYEPQLFFPDDDSLRELRVPGTSPTSPH